mgnify:CR=1 FL=1
MKRIFLTGLFASLIAVACFAQKPYKVVFYNFENLFDTIHDPGVLDEEFTPEGPKKINEPTGRLGSFSPERLRRIALESAVIASS